MSDILGGHFCSEAIYRGIEVYCNRLKKKVRCRGCIEECEIIDLNLKGGIEMVNKNIKDMATNLDIRLTETKKRLENLQKSGEQLTKELHQINKFKIEALEKYKTLKELRDSINLENE